MFLEKTPSSQASLKEDLLLCTKSVALFLLLSPRSSTAPSRNFTTSPKSSASPYSSVSASPIANGDSTNTSGMHSSGDSRG